jgi:death-on-curing protein
VFDIAACYLWGIVRNHGFADGDKRTAWVAARVFLLDHGVRIAFDKAEAVRVVERAAAGELTQARIAAWFRDCQVTSLRLQQGP